MNSLGKAFVVAFRREGNFSKHKRETIMLDKLSATCNVVRMLFALHMYFLAE